MLLCLNVVHYKLNCKNGILANEIILNIVKYTEFIISQFEIVETSKMIY